MSTLSGFRVPPGSAVLYRIHAASTGAARNGTAALREVAPRAAAMTQRCHGLSGAGGKGEGSLKPPCLGYLCALPPSGSGFPSSRSTM